MIIPYDLNTETGEILHLHDFSNKLCLLSTPLGIHVQFSKTNALFMMAISTAWLYTYQLNSSFAFFILFLPIATCSYECFTGMHWVFYTAFNGEPFKEFSKSEWSYDKQYSWQAHKRLQGRHYQEENVLGMYFPCEAQRLTNQDQCSSSYTQNIHGKLTGWLEHSLNTSLFLRQKFLRSIPQKPKLYSHQ